MPQALSELPMVVQEDFLGIVPNPILKRAIMQEKLPE